MRIFSGKIGSEEYQICIQPPTQRTIIFNNQKYFLKFPYVIFIFSKGDLYVFGSFDEITNTDQVFILPLPNIDSWGRVCLGSDILVDNIEDAIKKFYSSEFDHSLISGYAQWKNQFEWKKGGEIVPFELISNDWLVDLI